jgi:hypothetical protein
MAHPQETREKLRRSYIFGQMSLEIASAQAGVAFATARRWKRKHRTQAMTGTSYAPLTLWPVMDLKRLAAPFSPG